MIDKLLMDLNEKQVEAVKTTEGYVRVIAGAGSGKTKALTSRYAYIVEWLGVNSSGILCVTFTNKAAQEMRKRVKALIGENSDVSLITTYHGFCARVLREDINKIQYPKSFIIMDVEDQKTILREVFKELNFTSTDFTFKEVLRYISKEKGYLSYLDFILKSKESAAENDLEKIFQKYLQKQQRNFALDFDDLINYTLYIFTNYKDVLKKWQKQIHYIQVDETQDSSQKQFLLMELLAKKNKNLFVVGDPDQTIYEWRGALPEILVDFDKKFAGTKTIIMDQNYRSTSNILNLGNHIIKNNRTRVDKDMFTNNAQGVAAVHFHAQTELEEACWIADEIKELLKEEKARYSDIAILYRASHVSRSIEQALIKENIPYTIFGGIRFFERKEIKDVLAYLRCIQYGDDFSFLRIINYPARGLARKFMECLSKFAALNNTSLLTALEKNIAHPELNKKGAVDFLNLVARFKTSDIQRKVSDLVKEILDETALTSSYRADGDTDRLDNIKEFVSSIILLENENGGDIDLEEYLQEISLYTDSDLKDETTEKVKLMTIHSSKGLEFPYVFLCGFTEGILPSARSVSETGVRAVEEERRLTYVAITRAEKRFYMTESEGFNIGTGLNKYPSRFLFELDEDFYIRKGLLSQEIVATAAYNIKREKINEDPENELEFRVGDFVNHPEWKKGQVIELNMKKYVYIIEFVVRKRKKQVPINFSYRFLEKIKEATGH